MIGRMVDVHADLDTITACCGGTVVACHPRAWTRHHTITDPTHVTTDGSFETVVQSVRHSRLDRRRAEPELSNLVRRTW